jgi:pseudouridine-5'-phosphate glycosidase
MLQYFDYAPEVEHAMREKLPILALESTMISHGLPYPHNLEIARSMEMICRENSVVPAIIGVIQGKIKIGLSTQEVELLIHDRFVAKASTRDLPAVIGENLNAGTTVAATLFCADYAGIKVFATGGIGGVHRGNLQDISADLVELARVPLAVVCSGPKAILDLAKTLEFLETYGVPVVGYRTDFLPGFYTTQTPLRVPLRIDNIPALSKFLKIHWQLGLTSSAVIANPIPADDEIAYDIIEPVITQALQKAQQNNIFGKELTPFLLSEIANVTQGRSLLSNINLIKNNVKLGAQLAHTLVNM